VSSRFTYADAERYLQSLELFGMRFGLERMRRLMTALDAPHERFECVQVVGTNGKSSTARMTAALLTRQGMRSGAYLSPHIGSFAERIEIEGRGLSRERFAAAAERAAQAAALVDRGLSGGDRVTQFEALTAAAYWELARAEVEVAVVEAGLGARYDATSVVTPKVLAITNVGLEHTRWLGPTERHIAEEKLTVLPEGGTLVAGVLGPEALAVAEQLAAERGADLRLLGRDFDLARDVVLRPLGDFQRLNFALATAAAEAMLGTLDPVAVRDVAAGIELPGRLEVVERDPLLVLDGAHNPDATRALRPALESLVGDRPLVAVISVLDDKDAAGMLSTLLPLCTAVVCTRSSHPRSLPPATLQSLCGQLGGVPAEVVAAPDAALARGRELAGEHGAVLVTGSIYLLGDLAREGVGRGSRVA
jgi:dihydrofolate synthase/folylpolyglutamate synthase